MSRTGIQRHGSVKTRGAAIAAAVLPGDEGGRVTGEFVFIGGEAETAAIEQAIETTLLGLNLFMKIVARRRLRMRLTPATTILLRVDGPDLEYTINGSTTVRTRLGGPPVAATSPTGDPMRMRQWCEGECLIQLFELEVGIRRDELRIKADGQHLEMKVEITSAILPRPLRYSLSYRRRNS